jgi:hypothetical protein
MAFLTGKLIFVVIFFLTGTSATAEVPVSYPEKDNHAYTGTSIRPATGPGMQWQLRPGENIPHIVRLMFPKDSTARDNLVRAIIHTNPGHFPDKTYRPLPPGTTFYFPDLRTIGAYAKPAARTRKPDTAKKSAGNAPQQIAPAVAAAGLNDSHRLVQLITQLEQTAGHEARELNALLKHTQTLELLMAEIQSILASNPATPGRKQADNIIRAPEADIPPLNDAIPAPEVNVQPIASPAIPPEHNAQPLENQILPDDIGATLMAIAFSPDNIFLLGVLLTLLVVILILRTYHKIKEKFAQSRDASLLPDPSERRQFEALLLRRNDKDIITPENPPGQIMPEARALIEQNNPEAAIQLLQKQLANNQHDIPSWLLLLELLYKSNNKRDFKKNARRFKRLGEFPDIWMQIQNLGNKLESNEPLYFDEQKRKEKFFSDAPHSI